MMDETVWGVSRRLRLCLVIVVLIVAVGMPGGAVGQELALGVSASAVSGATDVRALRALLEGSGDPSVVRAWIEQGGDVKATESDGSTALHWASYWDYPEAVEVLVNAGADVNHSNDLGVTPLWVATENGNPRVARTLLDAGADPNRALESGETPAMTAARAGHVEVLQLLLSSGADPNARATRNQTALMWAASQQHAGAVEALLRHGADVNARSDSWRQHWQTTHTVNHAAPEHHIWIEEGGHTPLLFAARVGDLASAKLLVAAGADVNDRSAAGRSALILAVQSVIDYRYLPRPYRPIGAGFLSTHALRHSDGVPMVQFLLEAGADPNDDTAGFTALHEAILRHDESAVRLLLEHGADPNAVLKTSTPVRRSSHDFFFDNPFVGATPFWLAARYLQPDVMRLLAEYGADPLAEPYIDYLRDGHVATGFPRVTEGPTTAAMAAVGMPRGRGYAYHQPGDPVEEEALALEAIKIAVEFGVDVNAANLRGRTVLDGATALRYGSVVEYLESLGARRGSPPDSRERQREPEEDL